MAPHNPFRSGTPYPRFHRLRGLSSFLPHLWPPQPRAHPPHLPHGSLTDFGTLAVASRNVFAVSPRGTLEIPAQDDPSHAGTALGAASVDPGLVCLQKPREGKWGHRIY